MWSILLPNDVVRGANDVHLSDVRRRPLEDRLLKIVSEEVLSEALKDVRT